MVDVAKGAMKKGLDAISASPPLSAITKVKHMADDKVKVDRGDLASAKTELKEVEAKEKEGEAKGAAMPVIAEAKEKVKSYKQHPFTPINNL